MAIKDSGSRREFATGAVRDIEDNKGEPSLMPLQVVANLLEERLGGDPIMGDIALFAETNSTVHLYHALARFGVTAFDDVETMLLEVAIHYSEGCQKYGRDNWKKGIPVNCYLDSTIRHYLKWRRGDKDEPHDRAVCWNILSCIWEVDYHDQNN